MWDEIGLFLRKPRNTNHFSCWNGGASKIRTNSTAADKRKNLRTAR